eukprot:TRINITY_DN7093_c0_g4_i1.p1 TRINITY_DN7093_c0_g4~~TRINITY_DN7093_c0_g4_i1.p1  ORF type:complete len:387 (+),score=52.96 TRINITY_DN7093_c0_g4_i1:56-1216(+)
MSDFDCGSDFGSDLGTGATKAPRNLPEFVQATNATMAVISTPGYCSQGFGPPFDFPCMAAIERCASLMHPRLVPAYDFAGSASQRDCRSKPPDRDMTPEDWSNPVAIADTQWARYWMGCVRGCLTSLLISAKEVKDSQTLGANWAEGARIVVALSISGGPITQVEKTLIPGVITGVISNLATRNIDAGGQYRILWLHFESFGQLAKALSGCGTVKYEQYFSLRYAQGLPCEWVDGDPPETVPALFQSLRHFPEPWCWGEGDPKGLADVLSEIPKILPLQEQLGKALRSCDVTLVKRLLEENADPNALVTNVFECYEAPPLDCAVLHVASPQLVQTLLDAKADINQCHESVQQRNFRHESPSIWTCAEGSEADAVYETICDILAKAS